MSCRFCRIVVLMMGLVVAEASVAGRPVTAGCPSQATAQSFTGAGRVTCPCFVPGEQAGAVFEAPPSDYPIEILRVGVGWGSAMGGTPSSLEQAIHIYGAGLPSPGAPVFTLEGPVLNDGVINQFDLEPLAGQILIESGSFAVTLEFRNQNAGNQFAPSVVHDFNGCQAGKNLVYAIPGGWSDACNLGLSGDWVFFVIYRPCAATTDAVERGRVVSSNPLLLLSAKPNPFREATQLEFAVSRPEQIEAWVFDLGGRRVAALASGSYGAGTHRIEWNGRDSHGVSVEPGIYFIEARTITHRVRRTLVVIR